MSLFKPYKKFVVEILNRWITVFYSSILKLPLIRVKKYNPVALQRDNNPQAFGRPGMSNNLKWTSMRKHFLSFTTVFFLIFIGKLFISSSPNSQSYESLFHLNYNIFALDLPQEMYFAGERVPLEVRDVRERLDRELHVNTYWQSSTLLLIKRANRYFPVVRPILKKYGIPDDFKYLPLIESGFQDLVSPAGAEGPWQFMSATGKLYGLQVNETLDERYNVAKATEAACRYFKDAYKILNNWTLVAAAYNAGYYGVKASMEKQRVQSYYDMDLNSETARYVFRLLAIKEIMEHPRKYGFHYKKEHLYQNIPVHFVKVDSSINDLVAFASTQGINFKILREMNPWIRNYTFPNPDHKTFYFKVPKDQVPGLQTVDADTGQYDVEIPKEDLPADSIMQKYLADTTTNLIHGPRYDTYVVKEGENMNMIAKKFGVKPAEIMQWNDLKSPVLVKGQALIIYRRAK
jgi:membrane-bound lytic murein transglycosylase D